MHIMYIYIYTYTDTHAYIHMHTQSYMSSTAAALPLKPSNGSSHTSEGGSSAAKIYTYTPII